MHVFVFQGTECEAGQTPVHVWKRQGESKVGKPGGCLQPAGKKQQLWDSVGHPVMDVAKGTGKAGSHQEKQSLCPCGYSHCLCHRGLRRGKLFLAPGASWPPCSHLQDTLLPLSDTAR